MLLMPIIVVVLAILFLLFLLRFAPWQKAVADPERLQEHLQPICVPALLNLIDPQNLEFLKRSLSSSDFRRAQRERSRALRIYVQRISYNTRILIASAEAAQRASDPALAESGRILLRAALETRGRAMRALASLYITEVFPGFVPDLSQAIQTYQSATARLDSLQSLSAN